MEAYGRRKKTLPVLIVILLIIVGFESYLLFSSPKKNDNGNSGSKQDSLISIINMKEKIINDESRTIKDQEDKIEFLKGSLELAKDLKEQISKDSLSLAQKDQIIKNLSSKKVYVKLEIPKSPNITPSSTSHTTSRPVVTTKTNKENVVSKNKEAAKIELPVSFAILTDKGWWPDWASKAGKNFPEIVDNNQGGYNLLIKFYSSSSISGRYGVTKNTIFVNADEIGSGDIKIVSNVTGWKIKNMKRVTNNKGTFYVYTP